MGSDFKRRIDFELFLADFLTKLTSVGKSAYFKGGSFLRLLFTLHCLLLVSVASLSWSPGEARNAQCYQNLLILFGHVFLNSSHFSATEISCHAVVCKIRVF